VGESIAAAIFEGHLAAHPEEASALGVRTYDARLSDPSRSAVTAELESWRRSIGELETASLDGESALDRDAALRFAKFRVRYIEDDRDAENLELALLPNAALQHAALHARTDAHWLDLAARARAVPAFLETHADNLQRGLLDHRAPDAAIAGAFVERILPRAAESVLTIPALAARRGVSESTATAIAGGARAASDAIRSFHRFVERVIVPASRPDVRLGEREVERRLRNMGVESPIADLLRAARADLEDARRKMIVEASALGFGDPREAIRTLFAAHPEALGAVVDGYRQHIEAATRFVRERGLVPVPDDLALDLAPLPVGIVDGAPVTNWPAPLLDPEGRGHVLYDQTPSAHTSVAIKNLAVHEGIPGHYLQSVIWQRSLANRDRAVRFAGVADHIAMSRGYFGAMLAVEGWAVHMEKLLFEHGFYASGKETLFFAVCDAIRAVRTILDLEIHAGDLAIDAAVAFIVDATFLSEGWAAAQVLRAKRVPLQGLTYGVGAKEYEQLLAMRPPRESISTFYARILAAGPLLPRP
jgi:uncharacterized protein (DUF885 family)